ncbi:MULTISPECIES: acyltransferase family protein [unclassified Paenibacillus]|uniref:acyltransferase family protein n=1 Tax=unclassified Paenibacillus TaxID=185978 RepID=UPI0038329286
MFKDKKIEIIQLLRGLAAVAVTFFHAGGQTLEGAAKYQWFSSGVDIFFIMSGFIMVYTTTSNDGSLLYFKEFLIKRLIRIFPLYAILTLLYFLVVNSTAYIADLPFLEFTILDIVKSIFFIPLILNDSTGGGGPFWGGSVLHTGWSLNYEIYFYLIFALSMLLKKMRWWTFFGYTVVTVIVLPIVRKGYVILDSRRSYGWNWDFGYLNLMTSPLILEFAFGVIIGLMYISSFKFSSKQVCWLLCTLSVSFSVWLLASSYSHGFGIGLSNYGYSYIILFFILIISSKTIEFKIPYFLIWLGNISFSLYLVHPIITHSLGNILWQYKSFQIALTGIPFAIFLTALSIAFAALCHNFLEKPLYNWFKNKLLLK